MNWLEKIKAMDLETMTDFLEETDSYEGFKDVACRKCEFFRETGECAAKDMTAGCKAAIRAQLLREVE